MGSGSRDGRPVERLSSSTASPPTTVALAGMRRAARLEVHRFEVSAVSTFLSSGISSAKGWSVHRRAARMEPAAASEKIRDAITLDHGSTVRRKDARAGERLLPGLLFSHASRRGPVRCDWSPLAS
jgi:hypothetical protein